MAIGSTKTTFPVAARSAIRNGFPVVTSVTVALAHGSSRTAAAGADDEADGPAFDEAGGGGDPVDGSTEGDCRLVDDGGLDVAALVAGAVPPPAAQAAATTTTRRATQVSRRSIMPGIMPRRE
jgi:hypothetical protein